MKCNSNLISLSKLPELGILYYNHSNSTILKQEKNTLGIAIKKENLFDTQNRFYKEGNASTKKSSIYLLPQY